MSTFDGMGRLEFATPREAWGGEATAFTPYLSEDEMLAYLGEETGIGLLSLVEREKATTGGRSLDILAETADGRRVAIENQYGVADHDHLTRGLAYAVATDARALVVVAEDHRDEFVSVADYLNEVGGLAGGTGILVWLVKVRAVRRQGDTVWSPEFVVQAEPNEWESAVRRSTTPPLASLDDFYAKAAALTGPEWAQAARTIIEECLATGMTESHSAQKTVSLYCPTPGRPGGQNAIQVWTNGDVVICRGYLHDYSGMFDTDEDLNALDQEIRRCFPDASWPEKRFYITTKRPDPEPVLSFTKWLMERAGA